MPIAVDLEVRGGGELTPPRSPKLHALFWELPVSRSVASGAHAGAQLLQHTASQCAGSAVEAGWSEREPGEVRATGAGAYEFINRELERKKLCLLSPSNTCPQPCSTPLPSVNAPVPARSPPPVSFAGLLLLVFSPCLHPGSFLLTLTRRHLPHHSRGLCHRAP